jgi:hypothetical protein
MQKIYSKSENQNIDQMIDFYFSFCKKEMTLDLLILGSFFFIYLFTYLCICLFVFLFIYYVNVLASEGLSQICHSTKNSKTIMSKCISFILKELSKFVGADDASVSKYDLQTLCYLLRDLISEEVRKTNP